MQELRRTRKQGFTLIELLIVIAIILILIAIALPNFLEAQIRAKLTKAKAELRSLNIAMQEYFLDWKVYPPENEQDILDRGRNSQGLLWLTSPIKYMGAIGEDPFPHSVSGDSDFVTFESGGVEAGLTYPQCAGCMVTWVIYSAGPSDEREASVRSAEPNWKAIGPPNPPGGVINYSSTNGTRSSGVIAVWGGDAWYIGVRLGNASAKRNYTPSSHDQPLFVDFEPYIHRMPPSLR